MWEPTRDELLAVSPASPLSLATVANPGIYAWWDLSGELASRWPTGFPPVDALRPLYVGIADKQSLAGRIVGTHLTNTRRSALRRSLAALLSEPLDLLRGAARHPRGKFGLEEAHEATLTDWIVANLRVTWVEHADPGAVEKPTIRDLLPPLNYTYATGSPYRAQMKALRTTFRESAPLIWVPKASGAV
jgi:hypothetical protein